MKNLIATRVIPDFKRKEKLLEQVIVTVIDLIIPINNQTNQEIMEVTRTNFNRF